MPDYESMSRKELMEERARIDKAIATVGDRDKRAALQAAEAAAREHGFSLGDLVPPAGGRGGRGRAKASADAKAPRYRNPDDPSQTWSGRGRRPRWFNEAEAAGRPREDLEVRGS
jgi:DNA-binding protein H-NS